MPIDNYAKDKKGLPRSMWMEVVGIDMKNCNLSEIWAQDRLERWDKFHVVDSNIVWHEALMMMMIII